MAKTYTFILGEDDGGSPAQFDLVKDKIPGNASTPTLGDFHVLKDDILQNIYVENNLDGSYSFEYTESGVYDVKIGSSGAGHAYQDELRGIYLVGDDGLTTADIVDDLVSTDTDKPLSANQGKELQDNKAEASDLSDHEAEANPHSGSASSTPGTGLTSETGQKLAVDYDPSTMQIGNNGLGVKESVFAQTIRANSLYDLEEIAGSSDGDTPASVATALGWQTSDSGYEKKYSRKVTKGYGDDYVVASIESYPVGSPGTATGQFKIELTDGSFTNYTEGTTGITDASLRELLSVGWPDDAEVGDVATFNIYMKSLSGGDFGASKAFSVFTSPVYLES